MITEYKDKDTAEGGENAANLPGVRIRPWLGPVGPEASSCAQIGDGLV